jgi:hypothetical protein
MVKSSSEFVVALSGFRLLAKRQFWLQQHIIYSFLKNQMIGASTTNPKPFPIGIVCYRVRGVEFFSCSQVESELGRKRTYSIYQSTKYIYLGVSYFLIPNDQHKKSKRTEARSE